MSRAFVGYADYLHIEIGKSAYGNYEMFPFGIFMVVFTLGPIVLFASFFFDIRRIEDEVRDVEGSQDPKEA